MIIQINELQGLGYRSIVQAGRAGPRATMGGGASKSTSKKPVGHAGARAPSSLSIAATTYPRDWNDEFQRALDLLDAEDYVDGYAQLAAVCSDFQAKAISVNDVIISELGTVDQEKTYLSSTYYSGGPGCTVYEANNIIFKVAHGGQGSAAWMELGNEFRSSSQVLRCRLHAHDKHASNISLPLMCVIDYKGFRTLCWGKLPRQEKLVLGWDPVLKGFVLDNPEAQQAIARAGKMLGLAGHSLGCGSLSVHTNFNANVVCWVEALSATAYRRRRCYVTNLKDMYPVDLSRGGSINVEAGDFPPDIHCEAPEKLRPEMVRRYATVAKLGGLSADIGLAPPRASPMAKYVHDGADDSLEDLKRCIGNMTRMQILETIDNLTKVLKDAAQQHEEAYAKKQTGPKGGRAAEPVPAMSDNQKLALVTTTLHAEGLNLRIMGNLRSKIKAHSHHQVILGAGLVERLDV